ncbi:MAG TPA: aspartate carbamoyltransferase regulatory subunit, partial [Euryarchaeota archaeon]|nr:aspartate carbamoyltransferase regulatory subunit [Euryarchaeota archaeon]
MQKDIRVRKINRGTVIDHISAGQALNVLKILGITKEHPKITLTVAINVPSKRIGVKDIVKVEGLELRGEEIDKISLIAPEATINIVRDYKVIEKKKVE